jgi:hypothetical protein
MKQKNKYHFNYDDIARYHSGEMSAAEMHVLEKAALNDPMLMDAMDGYLKIAVDQKEIADLNAKIIQVEKPSGLFYNRQLFYSLSLAASLLVVVFVGYQFLQKQMEHNISIAGKIRKEKPTPKLENPSEQNNVVIKDNSNTKVTKEETPTRVKSVIKSNREELIPEQNVTMADFQPIENSSNTTTEPVNTDVAVASTVKEQQESETKALNQIESISFSKVPDDLKDNVKDNVKDEVSVKAVAVTRVQMSAAKNENFTSKKVNEIVVKSQSMPINGWTAFQQYVNENRKTQFDLSGNSIKGKVSLNFNISKKGKPQSIKIISALCESCDNEAIRLIKEGPLWKKLDNKKVEVEIIF